jgi:hypothetical protein
MINHIIKYIRIEGMEGTKNNKMKKNLIRLGSAFTYLANPPQTPKNFLSV